MQVDICHTQLLPLTLQLLIYINLLPMKGFPLIPLFFNWRIILGRFLSWNCCWCFWKLYIKTWVRSGSLPCILNIISPRFQISGLCLPHVCPERYTSRISFLFFPLFFEKESAVFLLFSWLPWSYFFLSYRYSLSSKFLTFLLKSSFFLHFN